MRKKLAIADKNYYFEECWSFTRFLIINSDERYEKWMYTNYNFITNNKDNEIIYGENGLIYDQHTIYNELLITKRFYYTEIKSSDIINYIKNQIINESYVLITLYKIENDGVHEILIYGFDDERKCFYFPTWKNNKIKTLSVSYENVFNSYVYMERNLQNYINNERFRLFYEFPITVLTLKKNVEVYQNDINNFYLFITKTLDGNFITINKKYCGLDMYTGYNGLLGQYFNLFDIIDKKIYNNVNFDFSLNVLRFIKYRRFFIDLVKDFISETRVNINNISLFDSDFDVLENIYLILLKHKNTFDDKTILSIKEKLLAIHENDFYFVKNAFDIIDSNFMNR